MVNSHQPLFSKFLTLLFSISLLFSPLLPAQTANQNPIANTDTILLSVMRGNPEKGGGEIQDYTINNGEMVFVKIDQVDQQEDKPDLPYEAKMDQLSNEVSNKISDIQVKQTEYAEEIYPAYRAPIDLDKQSMQKSLEDLRNERDKVESEQRSKQAAQKIQKANAPRPRAKMAAGLNIQVTVDNGNVSFNIIPKGLKGDNAKETTIQAAAGQWIKVLGKEDTGTTEVWIKAMSVAPQ